MLKPKNRFIKLNTVTESFHPLTTENSERSTFSVSDVNAVIEALSDLIPQQIAQGKIVRLGDFGSFSISFKSEGVEKPEDFEPEMIKGHSLNFRPGRIVQKALKTDENHKLSV